jgi:hypothetical protein
MSQEDENYITPIFPLDSEEFQDGGASIRNVTQFLDSYSQTIIGNFKKGYTVGITKAVILPAITDMLVRDKSRTIVPIKTFNDLKSSKAVTESLKTTPFFYLNQFFTKTEAMDDLRIKSDPAYDEDKQLLLLEISVRLYVLIYLCMATANTLCASGTKSSGDLLFKEYFTNKREATLGELIQGLKSRWVDADIQVCLFGIPKDDPAFSGFPDFEILCKILYDYALVIYLEGFHYPSDLIKKFQESYYFSSMTEFIQEMEKKVAAMPAPVNDCAELKKVLDDKTKVKDPKAITKEELAAITAAEPKYTKDFITTCLAKTDIFKAGDYAFAPDAAPPPDECIALKAVLDNKTKVKDPKAITKEELTAITAAEPKYTKDFITTCLAKTDIFKAGDYAFAPEGPIKTPCQILKEKLDEPGFVANKKEIIDADIEKLKGINATFTKEFIVECFKDTALFPAGEYALEDKDAKAAAAKAAANKAAANIAAAAKRNGLRVPYEALDRDSMEVLDGVLTAENRIKSLHRILEGAPYEPTAEDIEDRKVIESAKATLEGILPKIKSANAAVRVTNAATFNEIYMNGINSFKQILEKSRRLGEKINTVAKKDLADQKAKYEAKPADGSPPSVVAEYTAFVSEYDNVAAAQRNLEGLLGRLDEITARVTALEAEFVEVRNAAPKRGGRKESRKMNRKTRRTNRSRNTRRKNRRT